jgi:hypothetical protein
MGLTSTWKSQLANAPVQACSGKRSVPCALLSLLLFVQVNSVSTPPCRTSSSQPCRPVSSPCPSALLQPPRLGSLRHRSCPPRLRGLGLESVLLLLMSLVRLSRGGPSLLDSICRSAEKKLWDQIAVALPKLSWLIGGFRPGSREVSLGNIGFGYMDP